MKQTAMNQLPTAEDLLQKYVPNRYPKDNPWKKAMIEFAKLHVEAALESAYNNLEYTNIDSSEPYVVEDSILNAYPLTNVK